MNIQVRQSLSFLSAVIVFILIGLFLVCYGKLLTHPVLSNTININTTSAELLVKSLHIDSSSAKSIISLRSQMRNHQFGSVYEYRKKLKKADIKYHSANYIVRTPNQVKSEVLRTSLIYAFVFLLAFIIIRRSMPDSDMMLLPIVALLSGFGLIATFTVKDPLRDSFVFIGQAYGIAFWGIIALLIPATKFFNRLILRRYLYAYALGAIALVILLILFGSGPGGVHLRLFGFEPVEVVKLLMVMFLAAYLNDRRGLLGESDVNTPRIQDFAPLAIIYGFALVLFKAMNDLGPAVLLFGTLITLLHLSTGRRRYPIIGIALLLIAGVLGNKLHMGFFTTRVTMWLHPWNNPDPRGGQLAAGLWGMATGGIFGSGLGLGNPEFIPRGGSDLVYATIGEEFGLFGSFLVLISYIFLIVRGFNIAHKASNEFDKLLAAGITTLTSIQAAMIIGGVTGLLPLTGITLPFISFGTSSLVVNFFSIGLLLMISNRTSPQVDEDTSTPHWTPILKRLAVCNIVYFAVLIGLFRIIPVQLLFSNSTALRPLVIPDRDGVSRAHYNPRLTSMAASIPRGRIIDRNGVVLAEDAPAESDEGVGYFVQDGRSRIYHNAESVAQLLYAIESPKSHDNPLGMDTYLRGYENFSDLLTFYRYRYLPHMNTPEGKDVHLTIDIALQQAAYDSLNKTAHSISDRNTGKPKDRGAAVVINVPTGEILASASIPSFDPNKISGEDWANLLADRDNRSTLLYRPMKGLYPPGSTFKIVTATSAIVNNHASDTYICNHVDRNVHWEYDGKHYSRRRITDEDGMQSHGATDMAKAIAVSCNVYFANAAIHIGPDLLRKTSVESFGMHHLKSVAKIAEDLPDCGYGQGTILTTPIDMAGVAETVANNGVRQPAHFMRPLDNNGSFLSKIFHKTEEPVEYVTAGNPVNVMNSDQAKMLQSMMYGVTTTGTARGVFDRLKVSVAGKTGSAQNNQGDERTHSWFIGFAPYDRPVIAFSCVIENGGFGRTGAAVVCRDIVRKAFE